MKNLDILKKIKKEFFDKDIISIMIFSLSLITGSSFIYFKKQDDVIKLSKSIYKNFDTKNDEIIYPKLNKNKSKIDLNINKRCLKNIKKLSIDVLKTNVNDLLSFDGLEEVTIKNYQYLTTEDKKCLSEIVNLKKLTILIDENNLNKFDIDVDYLSENVNIVAITDFEYHYDFYDFLTYKMITDNNNINKNKIDLEYTLEEIEQFEKWDQKITKIVESFNFDSTTSEDEKVYTIIKYVSNNLDYNMLALDSDYISNLIVESITISKYYNENIIGSYLTDEDKKGVCCNYAALSTMLGYYSDTDINFVKGWYGPSHDGHAWCKYNDRIIDPTFIDGKETFPTIFKDLITEDDSYYYEDYMTDLYDVNEDITKKVSYINEEAFLYNKMKNNNIKQSEIIMIMLLISLYINEKREPKGKVKKKHE